MVHANEECVKPSVNGATYVGCLREDKLTVATLDNTLWALVNEKGALLTDYAFDNFIDINDTLLEVASGSKKVSSTNKENRFYRPFMMALRSMTITTFV